MHRLWQRRARDGELGCAGSRVCRRSFARGSRTGAAQRRDLLQPFDEARFHHSADVVTCNPPYISSKKLEQMPSEIISFEPRLAFDGGALGVKILQRTIREAPQFLRSGGWLLFEVGLGQGPAVMQRLASTTGYSQVRGVADVEGQTRVVVARRD
jgi:release factor glutamine methyltransferase